MSEALEPIVTVNGLIKRFATLAAVDGLSFIVNRGEIFGLVGPDRAGKTATMRMLAGVMQPDSGDIVIDGVNVVADPRMGSSISATCRNGSVFMRTSRSTRTSVSTPICSKFRTMYGWSARTDCWKLRE
jgi:ABC-type multidrug transport system ATPase subunit